MRKELWLVVLLWILSPVLAAKGVVWDFEEDESEWYPRASTLDLRRLSTTGATEISQACLQVTGIVADGYNYILSGRVSVQGGKWYRLAGWIRVDLLGKDDPMPYFKCEFLSKDGKALGLVVTDPYNDVRMGTWQQLSRLFEAPAGAVAGIVALEKGTKSSTEIHALVDDVSVEAISEAGIYQQCSVPSISKSLAGVRDVHPRLFLTDDRIEELQQAIQTTHAGLWAEIKHRADSLVSVDPPSYKASSSDPGQLWQRSVGNAMPYLAIAYRLTGQTKYLEAAKRWALASCSYPQWGLGDRNNTDLATGHQLFGLALVYDWCYHDFDQSMRDRIRTTLVSRANAMFEMAAKGELWWHNLYMQNHLWVNICGLGAAGLAVFDEAGDDALLWVGMAVQKLETTMSILGPDGAGHEGVGYWEYGVEHMLKLMQLTEDLLDIDFHDQAWWKNAARYSLYLSLPRSSWARYNSVASFADSPPHHWYGPDHILRHLATRYNDGYAQWLADQVDTAEIESSNAQWLNLIWYKPSVPLRHPRTLPTLHHFTDMGIVSARSGWTGDENLVALKCGPFIGHKAIMEFTYDPGGHHTHPDAGHFVVFANGEWLFNDDGVGPKWTNQHNTLLIGGKGQLGEGSDNFESWESLRTRARPRILTAVSEPQYDHIAADVTPAYSDDRGLKRFVRHLLFVKPDVLLVLDDVVCGSQKNMELRFHPASEVCETAGNSTIAIAEQTAIQMELLTPKDVATRIDEQESGDPVTVRYLKTGREWRNAVALSWADIREDPQLVTLKTTAKTWKFLLDGKTLTFDWELGEAALEP